jgi:hypothetical protein
MSASDILVYRTKMITVLAGHGATSAATPLDCSTLGLAMWDNGSEARMRTFPAARKQLLDEKRIKQITVGEWGKPGYQTSYYIAAAAAALQPQIDDVTVVTAPSNSVVTRESAAAAAVDASASSSTDVFASILSQFTLDMSLARADLFKWQHSDAHSP